MSKNYFNKSFSIQLHNSFTRGRKIIKTAYVAVNCSEAHRKYIQIHFTTAAGFTYKRLFVDITEHASLWTKRLEECRNFLSSSDYNKILAIINSIIDYATSYVLRVKAIKENANVLVDLT